MNIKIRYFASLREEAGKNSEEINCTVPKNLSEIYNELARNYSFSLPSRLIKFSVNGEYVDDSYQLKENDTIVFITPVAGG